MQTFQSDPSDSNEYLNDFVLTNDYVLSRGRFNTIESQFTASFVISE